MRRESVIKAICGFGSAGIESAPSRTRVELFDYCFEAAFFNVGIDLSGRYVRMAEQFLDDAQIGSAAQKVRGKAVAHQVWIDICFDARTGGVLFDELADARCRELFSSDR